MATPWSFAERINAYRAEGITKIVIMKGAQTHNRDRATGKPFGPVHGVLIHHTAGVGPGMDEFVFNGTRTLPGPLCHDFLAKDGTLYVVGHGRTNHAGTTTPAVKSAIIAEREPNGQHLIGEETIDANDFLFGLEIENKGNGSDPYPTEQMEVAVRWAAAHARYFGWSANSVWAHKEITRRKIDPSFSMIPFRARVAARLKPSSPAPAPAPSPAPQNGVPDMDFTSLARTTTRNILAGQSYDVYWDAEYQDGAGDHGDGGKTIVSGEHYTGTLHLAFQSPLPVGVRVQPFQELDAGGESGEPATPLIAGTTQATVSMTGRVPEDRNLVVTIINDSPSDVVLSWAGVRLGTWPL